MTTKDKAAKLAAQGRGNTHRVERANAVDVVRCRECSKRASTTDGRLYCTWHSRIVPEEGYCWTGER